MVAGEEFRNPGYVPDYSARAAWREPGGVSSSHRPVIRAECHGHLQLASIDELVFMLIAGGCAIG